jgi:hypothetical protein
MAKWRAVRLGCTEALELGDVDVRPPKSRGS